MGAVMPIFEETDQKKLEGKERVKVSSILEDMVRSALTIHELYRKCKKECVECLKFLKL